MRNLINQASKVSNGKN
jgi:hypothetical protein